MWWERGHAQRLCWLGFTRNRVFICVWICLLNEQKEPRRCGSYRDNSNSIRCDRKEIIQMFTHAIEDILRYRIWRLHSHLWVTLVKSTAPVWSCLPLLLYHAGHQRKAKEGRILSLFLPLLLAWGSGSEFPQRERERETISIAANSTWIKLNWTHRFTISQKQEWRQGRLLISEPCFLTSTALVKLWQTDRQALGWSYVTSKRLAKAVDPRLWCSV